MSIQMLRYMRHPAIFSFFCISHKCFLCNPTYNRETLQVFHISQYTMKNQDIFFYKLQSQILSNCQFFKNFYLIQLRCKNKENLFIRSTPTFIFILISKAVNDKASGVIYHCNSYHKVLKDFIHIKSVIQTSVQQSSKQGQTLATNPNQTQLLHMLQFIPKQQSFESCIFTNTSLYQKQMYLTAIFNYNFLAGGKKRSVLDITFMNI